MRAVDAARGGGDEGRGIALRVDADLVGDREQPEEAIDLAIGGERQVDEATPPGAWLGDGGARGVTLVDERREKTIASVETPEEQLLGDGEALARFSPRFLTMPSR